MILRDLGTVLNGVQKATESFRNTAWNESQKNLEALIDVAGKAEKTMSDVKRVINAPDAARLIEGKTN